MGSIEFRPVLMALSLAKAAPLKPEIKLVQALSEFEAVLPDDQKRELRNYRGQSPPDSIDVMRFTAEIDRNASLNRKSRQCVGTRLTNVLHGVQQFSTVVDLIVGSGQSQIAGAVWGTVKISLRLASTISDYFDQLSTLFMRIGLTCPRYQDFGLLYPESRRLQSAVCEYYIVIVRLCKQAVLFLKKPFWAQLSSSLFKPFEAEFGGFQQDLENLASAIREEVSLASNQAQQTEARKMSRFRSFVENISDIPTRDIGKVKIWKRKEAELQFLNAFSVYSHEKSWKQARKRGNTNWIFHDEGYKHWKREMVSSTLWCTGILGSGKTVVSASVVEDLKITTPAAVAYFFCRYDEAESLETRTIIGSIARQMFDHIKSDIVDAIAEIRPGIIDTDQILDYIQELLPSNSQKYVIIIDGLDECGEAEKKDLLQCLKKLLVSKHVFQVYCSSRPDVFRWAQTLIEPQWSVSMPQTSIDIEKYIEDTLVKNLEMGSLSIGDPKIVLTIQDTLLKKAHGMFLWVAFQIDSICCQKTDEAILSSLEDLPKDLPETFNRILRNIQDSSVADPQFCGKVFDLVAVAQRPLTLDELREAVSVTPGETSWDTSKLVNDMLRSLLDSCGSLVAVDEEHLTVHFAHHSVMQHLLSEPTDSNMRKYHINLNNAGLYLGDVIVTYLNFGIFDRQLAKAKSKALLQVTSDASAILEGSLPPSNLANRWAVRLLKSRGNSRQLKIAAEILDESKEEHTQPAHPFLPYAQKYWLFHTKLFNPKKRAAYTLWRRLINGEVKSIELPWAPQEWDTLDDKYMKCIMQNEHWALIDLTLTTAAHAPSNGTAVKILLEFLQRRMTGMKAQNLNFGATLYLASYLNNKVIVLLSFGKGVDVDAFTGYWGTAFQAASRAGHEEILTLLLENGADVNAVSGNYGTELHAALEGDHKEMARFLLKNGADVNAVSEIYGTVLQRASKENRKGMARLFLDNGADVDAEGGQYGTALHAASIFGHEEIMRLLLENGANFNAVSKKYGTALQAASRCGHEAIVRLLLKNGADVNAVSEKEGTALHAASDTGSKEMVRLLLDNGADVNAKEGCGSTALQVASGFGHEEIVEILLENGANVNAKGWQYGTALHAASIFGHEEISGLLLENGANFNAVSKQHGTALQAASRCGHEAIVRLLLKNGADINAVNKKHGTVLQAASEGGRKEMVRLLLDNGADVNAKGGLYGTALHAALTFGHEETVELLLENGANVDAMCGYYGTALQAASTLGRTVIVRMLLMKEANVNAEAGHYGNALQAASRSGREAVVRLLLEYGANVNAQTEQYGTALQAASARGYEKIMGLLLGSGAIADNKTMLAASTSGNGKAINLIRNALKQQSSLEQGPNTST